MEAMERLDLFLAKKFDAPRAQIQKLLKTGAVTVNGKAATAHTLVSDEDVLVYPEYKKNARKPKIVEPEIPVLYEDDDVIVVNKPAGVIVHPVNAGDRRPSVIGALLKTRKELKKIGENKLRPGVVHRLDKDVSGVMVVAKSQAAFESLKAQFTERETEKEYVALVYGKMPKEFGSVDFKIARSKHLGRMVSRPEGQDGKEALTDYMVVERLKTCTLVDVKIHTGRTHQIRTHFKAIGHPVVGDTLYHTKIVHIRPIELGRLFLHAKRLSITLPDGTRKTFTAPLPEGLAAVLKTLPRT